MHELLFTEYIFGGNGGEINTAKRSLSHNYTRNVSKLKHTHIFKCKKKQIVVVNVSLKLKRHDFGCSL